VDDFSYAGDPALRIGTAERERAASALSEHFAAGRIDQDELEERLTKAYAARTGADLIDLFTDLPGPAVPARGGSGASEDSRPGHPGATFALLLVGALLVVGWVFVVRVPPFVLIPLIWFALARRGHRRGPWGASHR
jgi:Domain of unknown function (DUF1707)